MMNEFLSLLMLTGADIENRLRLLKPLIEERFFVKKIGYFGSFAKNKQREDSDIDLIVEFSQPLGWEFFDLTDLLEKELQRKVDLVSIKALKPQLKESILASVKYIV